MRTYLMIYKTLHSKKQLIKFLIHFIVMYFIVYFIVYDFYTMYSNYAFYIHPYKYGNYDAIIYETTEKDIQEQFTPENIAGVASITGSSIQCKFICNDKEFFQHGTCETVGAPEGSFQSLMDVAFHGELLRKEDPLLNSEDTIILSDAIAMRIKANIGDTVYLQCYTSITSGEKEGDFIYHFNSDQKYAFRVGAIYRFTNNRAGRAVISANRLKEIVLENYPERGNQDNVIQSIRLSYICFKDLQSGLTELDKFIPTEFSSYLTYGDTWKENLHTAEFSSYEEYASYMLQNRIRRYELRADLLAYAENSTVINSNVILFKTLLATAAITVLFVNQNYKTLKLNRKSFGILSSAGMPRRKIFIYITVTSFAEQIMILILSFLMMYGLYINAASPETMNVFTAFVTVRAYVPLLIGVAVASVLSGLFASWEVSKKKIQEALSAE